jgi:putative membrane protein
MLGAHAVGACGCASDRARIQPSRRGRDGVDLAAPELPVSPERIAMRWVFFVPLLVLLVLFALSNTQDVDIRLWPFDLAWVAPLGMAVLLAAGMAFLLGAVIAWASAMPARRRAARVEQAATLLEAELAALREKEAQVQRDANMGRVPDAAVVPLRAAGGR